MKFLACAAVTGSLVVVALSCTSSSDGPDFPTGGGDSSDGGSGGSGGSGAGGPGSGGNEGGNQGCATLTSESTLEEKGVDIIFAVGNNGSLAQEIDAVEQNINQNFASIIGQSGVDYRVILVSKSGGHGFNICIEAPLGGLPAGECANQPNNAEPVQNPPHFYHYSAQVWNNDAWCVLMSTYDGSTPDDYGHAPNGWSQWLRPDTVKVFVVLSDSSMKCTYMGSELDDGPQQPNLSDLPGAEQAALDFDTFLTTLSPTHFGTPDERNYIWHSIVGLEAKDPINATDPWLPADPLSIVKCTGDANVVSPALGHQASSRLSGGLRFPICEWQNFDTVFNTLAQGIIAGAAIQCDLPLPDAPTGQTLDLDHVTVTYTATGGAPEDLNRVADLASCMPDSFYVEDDMVKLCPEMCARAQADDGAALEVNVACKVELN